MGLYFSSAAGGFFDDEIHDPLPASARPVTRERHAELMHLQGQGKVIAANVDGDPIAIDPPLPDAETRLATIRAIRDRLLQQCDFTQMPDSPLTLAQRTDWAIYRQALRDMPATIENLDAVQWPAPPAE